MSLKQSINEYTIGIYEHYALKVWTVWFEVISWFGIEKIKIVRKLH